MKPYPNEELERMSKREIIRLYKRTVEQFNDAVPVRRCKDCGHWDYVDSGIDGTAQGECFVFSMMTDDMCFCCWAERKDDIVIIHPEDIVFNSEEDEKAYYEALGAERKEE